MADSIEVEVVCPKHQRDGTYLSSDCVVCGGNAGANSTPGDRGTVEATLAPGSLVALKVAMVYAVVAGGRVPPDDYASTLHALARAGEALIAVRDHPDCTEPT